MLPLDGVRQVWFLTIDATPIAIATSIEENKLV